MSKGSVMIVAFQIEGQDFVALNGGPVFQITPVISFFLNCDTTQEIDRLWEKLSEGGKVLMELDKYHFSERYGWIQDKFGISWQIVPVALQEILRKSDPEKLGRVMEAVLQMNKLDISVLKGVI